MYSEDDINSAVVAGALSPEAAASFRAHMTQMRHLPRSSEENVKLINSFNDIFVAIGIVILGIAMVAIGSAVSDDALGAVVGGALVAATAWPLAEFFTRQRRMALPSILLLLGFVGGVFASLSGLVLLVTEGSADVVISLGISMAALIAAGAAYLHWQRFMVPITVAAGTGAVAATVLGLILSAIGPNSVDTNVVLGLVFVAGLCVFAYAMRWDMSDRARTTRRSDAAFWLHLLAAPMIAHPIFALLGVTEGYDLGVGAALGVLGVYVGFGVLALAVDRRALLVSALAYVLYALTSLFQTFGAVELNLALTALVIGSALLSLSAFWQPIRKGLVEALPQGLQDMLPPTADMVETSAQPGAA